MIGNGVILVNRELVLAEIMELATLKVSGILKVPLDRVGVHFEIDEDEGKMFPCIDIHQEDVAGLDPATVRQVVGTIYERLKLDMTQRLNGLRYRRDSFHPDADHGHDDNA